MRRVKKWILSKPAPGVTRWELVDNNEVIASITIEGKHVTTSCAQLRLNELDFCNDEEVKLVVSSRRRFIAGALKSLEENTTR